MYSNIGKKIKGLSIFLAWVGVIASFTTGFMYVYAEYEKAEMIKLVVITAGIVVGGSLLSWFSSWILYGFGRLVDNSTQICEKLEYFSIPEKQPEYVDDEPQYVEPQPAPKPVENEIPLEGFNLPETRGEMFQSQLRKLKKDYEMSRITYDEYDSAKKRLMQKYK